jgi:transcriptional regulator with XRE-family HTH domain
VKIGSLIKLLRTTMGLSQKDMADKVGISPNYLSLIESGKREASTEVISQIAKTLTISKEALLLASLETPSELENKKKADFVKLQNNVISLLIFEVTGELTNCA